VIKDHIAGAGIDQHADLLLLGTLPISDREILNEDVIDVGGDLDDGLDAAGAAVADDEGILVQAVGLADQRHTPVNDHVLIVSGVRHVNRIPRLGGIDR
jgi:hypothetical protein